jgi:hypothetical protein
MEQKGLQLYRPGDYADLAAGILTSKEIIDLERYIANGGKGLAPESAAKMFELFLNGSSIEEIHRLNKAFPVEAIIDARIKYRWDENKDAYAMMLQRRIRDKVAKAQLETTELYADLLAVARKQQSDKLKKYLQSGDEKDLEGTMAIGSLQNLLKITEGLLKITGQDKNSKVEITNTQDINVSVHADKSGNGELSSEDAAKILAILSEAKKR